MIVQPNFLDHWKTRLLQTELQGDPLSPTYILRLWGHCQEQKDHKFAKLSAPALAAICHFNGAPQALWLAIQNAGFILVKGETVIVHEWDEYNAGLIRNWDNGRKGGRPRTKNKKPMGSAGLTQSKPSDNPDVTDGLDRIEKIDKTIIHSPAEIVAMTPRPRNLVMDELANVSGIPLSEIGSAVAKRLNHAITLIKQSTPDLTAEEVKRRAANYSTHMNVACTPEGLVKHWALSHAPNPNHRVERPRRQAGFAR